MFVNPVAMYTDSSIDVTVRICAGACADMHKLTCGDMCVDMCVDMCIGMSVDMCIDMSTEKCMGRVWACI